LEWIDDVELNNLNLWDGDRIFLEWLDRPELFSAKFVYKDGNFVDYNVLFYPTDNSNLSGGHSQK
ncbi:MAG: mutX, partial [Chloroflexi bacterium]|nr:mutX [Chloroflexota bacterium]